MSVGAEKVAVVGAAGFLGTALTATLRSRGTQTLAFTRNSPALRSDGRLQAGLADADTIFWMASTINPLIAEAEPTRVESDLRCLQATLRALRAEASSARFVLLSSGGTVYDPTSSPPYSEDSRVAPKGAYGRAKLALGELALTFRPESTVVRVANAFGAGQALAPGQGVLGHWLRAIRRGLPIQLFGPVSSARDYLNIRDITSGLLAIHQRPAISSVLNLGSGRATTLGELVGVVRAVCGDVVIEQFPARGFDLERTWLDISRARRELDWEPQVDLADGVTDMWEWLRANPNS